MVTKNIFLVRNVCQGKTH